jgi:hypothetical protein
LSTPLNDKRGIKDVLKNNWKFISSLLFLLMALVIFVINFTGFNTYQVDFYDINDTLIFSGIYDLNDQFEYPDAPEVIGYDFDGWVIENHLNSRRISVFSEYSLKQYEVRFVDYDGTIIEMQRVFHGEDANFSGTPSRIGHTFIGWNHETTNIQSDWFIFAIYEIEEYIITFMDGNREVLTTQTIKFGESIVVPDEPTKEDHIFEGWDQPLENPTSNLTINPIFREVPKLASVQTVTELNVLFGTTTQEVLDLLPQTTIITDTWDQTWEVDLNWVLYEFNAQNPAIAPGRFIVSGLFELPDEVSRGDGRTPVDTFVNVGPGLVSIEPLEDLRLPIGSTLDDLKEILPDETIVMDTLNQEFDASIVWDEIDNFDQLMRTSSFTLKGSVILPEGLGTTDQLPAIIEITIRVVFQ